MFQLNDQFLTDIGLGSLPEEQKRPFLEHLYLELQDRVGRRLSEGMSDAQLEEFENIIDKKEAAVQNWLQQFAPQYASDELYLRIQQQTGLPAGGAALNGEYAATKWLEVNRPDYRDVVSRTLEELKQEIIRDRDAILGTSSGGEPAA